MATINGVTIDTKDNQNQTTNNGYSINKVNQYYNNPFINSNALDKYLCNTIQESLDSIDVALAIKDYDIINQKLRIH